MASLAIADLAGLHHAALSVKNLDASIEWYAGLFGFEETFRRESETRRVVVLRFPGLGQTLGLVEHVGAGTGFDPANIGLDTLAFSVASGEELAGWARRFDERGITNSGVMETPFGGMLNFADLDGIALALFWERG